MKFPHWLALALCVGSLHAADPRLVEYYLKQLEANPAQLSAQDRLLELLKKSGTESAFFEKLQTQESEDVVRGYLLLRQKKYPEARTTFEKATANSSDAWPWRGLADLSSAEGKPEEAARALEKALEKESTAELLLLVAEKWHDAGKDDKADSFWQKAIAADPNDRDLRKRLARRFTELGRTEAALEQWQTLGANAPTIERFEILTEVAKLQEKQNQTLEAATTLQSAETGLSSTSWQRTQLDQDVLRLYRQAGMMDKLEVAWRLHFKENPRDSVSALRLAALLAEQGKFDDQRQTLRDASSANPDSIALLQALAEADRASGNPADALKDFESLGRRQPGKLEPLFAQAELLIRLGKIPEAISRLETFRQAHEKDRTKLIALRAFLERNRLTAPLLGLIKQLAAADPNEITALLEQQLLWDQPTDKIDVDSLALPATRKAEMAAAISELFQRYEKTPEAIQWASKASELQPTNAKLALHVVDLLPREDGADWLEKWIAQNGGPLPPEEVDQRLYQLTVTSDENAADSSPAQRSLDLIWSLPKSASEPASPSPQFVRIQKNYAATPSPESAQRLARWFRWMRDLPAAAAELRLAIEKFPKAWTLREELARTLADLGDYPGAIQITEQLLQNDTEHAFEHEQQIAFFEMDRGGTERALAIFQKQADEKNSPERWRNLATAQGNADFWFDSFESWLKAAAVATPQERYEMRASVLNIAERLHLNDRAKTFLGSLVEETKDAARKQSLRDEAEVFNSRTQNTSTTGEIPTISAPPSDAGPSLAEAKIRALSREPSNLEAWFDLARVSDPEEMPAVWNEITQRFPRDPQALTKAAEYFQKNGNPQTAATLLSRELELGGATAAKHLAAGKLHLTAGDRVIALDHFERAWKLTTEPAEPSNHFPIRTFGDEAQQKSADRSALSRQILRGSDTPLFPKIPTLAPQAALRLAIIQEISRLARGGSAKATWMPRWQSLKDPAEKVTALYFIGETAGALDELNQILETEPDNLSAAQSFFSLCVEQANFDRAFALFETNQDHFSNWLDVFLLSLNQKLAAFPQTDLASLQENASKETLTARALRWPLAALFANNQRYQDAAKMGNLALDSKMVPDWSDSALNVAYWHLSAGEFSEARETAARAGEEAANTFTHPALTAARMEWLLSKPEQQKQLFEEAKAKSALPSAPPLAAARYVLFSALGRRQAEIPRAMERLINAQKWVMGTDQSANGFSSFVRNSSGTLLQWGQPDAAAELLSRAIEVDPVLMLLRGQMEDTQREELRLRLIATRLLAQSPLRRAELLRGMITETALPLDSVMQFGLFFEQAGNFPAAYLCYEVATQQFGLNDALLAARLRTARSGTDSQAWIDTCQLAAKVSKPAAPSIPPAAASQLALIAVADGKPADAEKILLQAIQRFPENEVLVRQAAENYLQNENPLAAQKLLSAAKVPATAGLVTLQIQAALALGKDQTAIDLFKKNPTSSAQLLPPLLAAYSQKGQMENLATEILPSLKKPEDQFSVSEALALTVSGKRQVEALAETQSLAAKNPNLLPSYYLLRKRLAKLNGTVDALVAELSDEWSQGRYFAGEILIQIFLEEDRWEDLTSGLKKFLDQPSVSENALYQLALLLDSHERWNEASTVYEKLSREHPASASYRLGLARSLTFSNRNPDATKPLAELHQARHLLPGALSALAQYHLTTGHPEVARNYFSEMKESPNAQEQSAAYLGLTQCALELGSESVAETSLREAAALDLSPQVARLAAELAKNDPPERVDERFKNLGLTPPLQRSAHAWLKKIHQNVALPSSP